MPENLYPQLPTSQESFNIEMVRKYHQDIENLTIDCYMHLQVQALLL